MNAQTNVTSTDFIGRKYSALKTHIDRKHECAWCYMDAAPRPCFTEELLEDLKNWGHFVGQRAETSGISYHVLASKRDGVFNLGGDLELFIRSIKQGDRDGLRRYAQDCIDVLWTNLSHCGADVTTISLVQGEALGGGFESALSSDVLIAEKGSRMGFPEILFNLFPGMGAYSLLSRKLDPKRAEQMILSGKIYSAEELFEMGIVDALVEPGEGEMAVYDYIKRENRARNGFRAMRKVRETVNPITYDELVSIVEIWVDAAMRLEKRDLRMMKRLVAHQTHKQEAAA